MIQYTSSRPLAFFATLTLILIDVRSADAGKIGVQVKKASSGEGLEVLLVMEGSPAERAGILAGDRILTLNGKSTPDVDSFVRSTSASKPGTEVVLEIARGDKKLWIRPTVVEKIADPKVVVPDDVQEALEELKDVRAEVTTAKRQNKTVVVKVVLWPGHVTDTTIRLMVALADLETVEIKKDSANAKLTPAGLSHLRKLSHLKHLALDNSWVTDEHLKQVAPSASIKSLSLNGSKITDAGLETLKGFPNLKELSLRETEIADAGMQHIASLPNLVRLDLYKSHIRGWGLESLAKLKTLRKLDLDKTVVADGDLKHLRGATSLEWLDLSRTYVTDAGLVHLAELKELRWLGLDYSGIRKEETDGALLGIVGLNWDENGTGMENWPEIKTGVTVAGIERHLRELSRLQELHVEGPDFEFADIRKLAKLWPKAKIVTSKKTINPK